MPVRYDTETIKLWSPLRQKLDSISQHVATAEQWTGLIRNFEKHGVSSTEIEWSGILDFLGHQTEHRIDKTKLLDILDNNPVCELNLVRQVNDDFAPTLSFSRVPLPIKPPPIEVQRGIR
jgi:hypothetical protein